MKVFLSWSGGPSHAIALVFRDWLPVMFGGLFPFVSSEDIEKGARWANDLDAQLDETDYGIVFLTPDNLAAPWLLYEAGALAKSVTQGRCACVLHEVSKSSLEYPLARFQATALDYGDLLLLIKGINTGLGDGGQGEHELEQRFELLWPPLEKKLENIATHEAPKAPPPVRSDRALLEEVLAAVRMLAETVESPADGGDSAGVEGQGDGGVPVIPPRWTRRDFAPLYDRERRLLTAALLYADSAEFIAGYPSSRFGELGALAVQAPPQDRAAWRYSEDLRQALAARLLPESDELTSPKMALHLQERQLKDPTKILILPSEAFDVDGIAPAQSAATWQGTLRCGGPTRTRESPGSSSLAPSKRRQVAGTSPPILIRSGNSLGDTSACIEISNVARRTPSRLWRSVSHGYLGRSQR